jgi:hypothetical protein
MATLARAINQANLLGLLQRHQVIAGSRADHDHVVKVSGFY